MFTAILDTPDTRVIQEWRMGTCFTLSATQQESLIELTTGRCECVCNDPCVTVLSFLAGSECGGQRGLLGQDLEDSLDPSTS